MVRALSLAAVGLALVGCPMDNPAWKEGGASGSGSDTAGTLTAASETSTTTPGTTTAPGTTTTMTSAGSATTSTATTDPTTGVDTSTTDPVTTDATTDTTDSGGLTCEVKDDLALGLKITLSDPPPFVAPQAPGCEEKIPVVIGPMAVDGMGFKITGVEGACAGTAPGTWMRIDSTWPVGFGPVVPDGGCARVFVHYATRGMACEIVGYQIFPQNLQVLEPLYLAGEGVVSLPLPLNNLVDRSPSGTADLCVPEPLTCDPADGTLSLRWDPWDVNLPEGASGACGDFQCYNLEAHVHPMDDPNPCAHHISWIVTSQL